MMQTDPLQNWLSELAAGGESQAPALPDPQALMAQLSAENPQLAGVMRLMAMQRQAAAESMDEETLDDDVAEERPDPQIRDVLQRMYAELEELRARNDDLADALGACYLCWGEDITCPECHGDGRPGSAAPDRVLFTEWVAPAVRRLAAGRQAAGQVKRSS